MTDGRGSQLDDSSADRADELRRRAEERLDTVVDAYTSADLNTPSREGLAAAVHELRVHQIEIEMQNEELCRTQRELVASREKYFELFDQAPVGYLTLDDQGIIGDANLTASQLLGVDRVRLAGRAFTSFIVPDDQDVFYLHQRAMRETSQPQTCELRLNRARADTGGGTGADQFWARIECRLKHSTDTETYIWVTFGDVDEHKLEQEKLAYILKALESSSDAIEISDARGNHIFQNKALSVLFEYDTAQDLAAAGGGPSLVKSPEVAKELFDTIEHGQSWAGELEMVTRSGHVFPAYQHADAVRDDDGKAIGFIGIITDITERKALENELSRERALLAQAESIGHIGSWRVAAQAGERRWSAEAIRILGAVPSDDGDGFETLRHAVLPEYGDVFETWLREASSSEEPHRADFQIARPDGDVRWVCAHGAREMSGEDGAVFVAGILHDVSDSKRMEEQRRESLEEAANVDRLTGLHNIRGFELLAEQSVAQARRAGQGVGLIFCDVDGLKSINDEFGHAQGDRALQDVASVLTYTLRSADAIGRIGGDEFLVLAVGPNRDSIATLNERLREGFNFFNATTTRPYRISLSSGSAWQGPDELAELDELKAAADKAMYEEKLRHRDGAE